VVVVGGGQAGLAAGYYLMREGIPSVILDASERVGDSWRRRWDSLELFTVGHYSALPGLDFPGDPERFAGKEDVADYLETYAKTFDLPVRPSTRAVAVTRSAGGYRIDTAGGSTFEATQVIIATGAYQAPYVPEFAQRLDDRVRQLHSSGYRNPEPLPPGEVLVVGGANSGVQIAQELSRTRQVRLAVGTKPLRLPRRILGKSLHWWGDHLGVITAPVGRFRRAKQSGDLLIGTSHRQLARRHGVELLGRVIGVDGRALRHADGRVTEPAVVIWATGFKSDYSWIDARVFDDEGAVVHRRGVTRAPGLYFLGMHLQHSLGSSLIGFVQHDAKFIVERISKLAYD
jgi:putative flavoprotein involved in K+ transport